MQLNLIPAGENAPKDGQTPVAQFFVNVGLLADERGREQAVILFGMLFTLVIWVITLINLMVAVVMYLLFLFHHIPSSDCGLTGYCRRKINKSMEKIVRTKVEKALRKENALLARQQAIDGQEAFKRQPTLPNIALADYEKPPMLSRQSTMATLPEYTSRPGTAAGSSLTSPLDLERQPSLPDIDSAGFYPGPPARTATHASSASWASHGSSAPLMGAAGGMGYAPSGPIENPGIISPSESFNSIPATNRSYSSYSHSTQRGYTPGIGQRPFGGQANRPRPAMYQMEPVSRSGTVMSARPMPGVSPSSVDPSSRWAPVDEENPYFPPNSDYQGEGATATLPRSYTPGSASARSYTPESLRLCDPSRQQHHHIVDSTMLDIRLCLISIPTRRPSVEATDLVSILRHSLPSHSQLSRHLLINIMGKLFGQALQSTLPKDLLGTHLPIKDQEQHLLRIGRLHACLIV